MIDKLGFAVDLVCSLLAVACWYTRPQFGPWPLLLLILGRSARFASGGRRAFRPTIFDLPLLLFLLSAGLGTLVAYDQRLAQAKFWQITGGLALAGSVAHCSASIRLAHWKVSPLRVFLAALPTVIATYFLLTNDWALWMGKFTWLDPAMSWFASWQPALPGHRLNPNLPGGAAAALIPLQIAVLFSARPRGARLVLAVVMVSVAGLGVLLTASRGAWTALVIGLVAWWLMARSRAARLAGTRRLFAGPEPVVAAVPSRGSTIQISLVPLLALGVLGFVALGIPQAIAGRLQLLHNALDLALDYPFTGLGLGNFEMAYSTYVLIVHVGHTIHSHNLWLDVWLEQGLLGLFALAWLVALSAQTVWRYLRPRSGPVGGDLGLFASLCLPAASALIVILVHGMVDDAFYASRAVMLFFIPFGVLAGMRLEAAEPASAHAPSLRRVEGSMLSVYVLLVVSAILAGTLLLPGVRAAFQANLGALAQTRAELSEYSWPKWPVQDELRRSGLIDLQPAIDHYLAALALDPWNPTANRRLGQLALATGQYDIAQKYLERAYAAAPDQRATRQLLGESYAVAGDPQRAAGLWRTIDMSAGQATTRAWWYGHIRNASAAQRIQAAASLANRPPATASQ